MGIQIAWDGTHNDRSITFDPPSDAFKPAHGSGLDDLAKEIISVTTSSPSRDTSRVYLGGYITGGCTGCDDPRFDGGQDGRRTIYPSWWAWQGQT